MAAGNRLGKLPKRAVRLGSRASRYIADFGFWRGASLALRDSRGRGRTITLELPEVPSPVVVRLGTSDLETLSRILVRQEYDVGSPTTPQTIVDAGANIGLASIWYASRYPDAKIVALEPEEGNFEILERNVSAYRNIVPLRRALWCQSGTIALVDPGKSDYSYRVRDVSPAAPQRETVPATTLSELMDEMGIEKVDLLKVDVEGAEKEIFETAGGWIDRVGAIVIELHDRFRDGCSRAFYNATTGFAHETRRGEHVCIWR